MTMTQSKYLHPHPGCDESLAVSLLSNQSLYPSSDWEATTLKEALAVNDNTPAPKTKNYFLTIGLEIVGSLLLIGVGLLVQLSHKTDIVTPTLQLETAENVDQNETIKNLGAHTKVK